MFCFVASHTFEFLYFLSVQMCHTDILSPTCPMMEECFPLGFQKMEKIARFKITAIDPKMFLVHSGFHLVQSSSFFRHCKLAVSLPWSWQKPNMRIKALDSFTVFFFAWGWKHNTKLPFLLGTSETCLLVRNIKWKGDKMAVFPVASWCRLEYLTDFNHETHRLIQYLVKT